MVKNDDVARAWSEGKDLKGNNMFSEERVLYSYGHHFPICFRIRGVTLFNNDKYSTSTDKHQSIASKHLEGQIVFCKTQELKDAIRNPEEPIILTKTVNPNSVHGALEVLKAVCKSKGMKRFPFKELETKINKQLVHDAL